jgi:uncharacterized protein YdeI (YjbR/CyaY-like superfamily)
MSDISGGLVHELPADLANALRHATETVDLWENLTPIARNEFIFWVGCIHRTDKKPGKWQQEVLIDKKPKN